MRLLAATLFLLAAAPTLAQTPGDCDPGTAAADLDISDVQATLFNNGNLFYDGGSVWNAYVVPKNSGHTRALRRKPVGGRHDERRVARGGSDVRRL